MDSFDPTLAKAIVVSACALMHDTAGQVMGDSGAVERRNSSERLLHPNLADAETTKQELLLFGQPLCG